MPTEAQWLSYLKGGYEVISKVELLQNGRLINPDFRGSGGSVKVNGSAATRRTFSFTPNLRLGAEIPTTPGVTELRPYRGIRRRGDEKYWPLGVFRVTKDDVSQVRDDLTYSIDASDISAVLTQNRLYEPVSVPKGFPVELAIERVCNQVLTGLTFEWPEESAGELPAMIFEEGEAPWTISQKLYAQFGYDLYPTVLGRIKGEVKAAADTNDFRSVNNDTLIRVQNGRELGYNGVKVVGEPDDLPSVHAYVYDDDPESPTYANGPYGRNTRFYKSKFLTREAQCLIVARRQYQSVGITSKASFTTLTDPTLEANRVYALDAPGINLGGRFIVDQFNVDLDIETDMDVTTAAVRSGKVFTELSEAA